METNYSKQLVLMRMTKFKENIFFSWLFHDELIIGLQS